MPKLSERGVVHLLVPIILLIGLAAGVYLVTSGNPLKLFSKASNPAIVFKNTDGTALSLNSSGIPQTTSATVKIEFTSTLEAMASPTPVPTASYTFCDANQDGTINTTDGTFVRGCWNKPATGECRKADLDNSGKVQINDVQKFSYSCPQIFPTPAPKAKPVKPGAKSVKGVSITADSVGIGSTTPAAFRYAENPTDLDTTAYIPYVTTPTVVTYTFRDTAPGQKFIWAEFRTPDGRTDRRSAQIELLAATSTPAPIPTSTPTPTPTATPSPTTSASLTISPTLINSDGTLTVQWSGISNPSLHDFINVITADGKNGVTSHTYWVNNDCKWSNPQTGIPKSSGSCIISFRQDQINTNVQGPYMLVMYSGSTPGVSTVLAESNSFQVIKRVFITSTTYNGNLENPSFPGMGGATGADGKCMERAYAANLGGNWKAWLSISPSDYPTSVTSRFTHNSGPYQLLNGVVVADNWNDLTDGMLQNPINLTELNTTPSYMSCVWTNTDTQGNNIPNAGNATGCNGYTSANSDYSWCGRNGSIDYNWTKWSTDRCDQVHPLYCFEQ